MNQIFATHITLPEGLTKRQIANRCLKAMVGITGLDNGTIRKPIELASSRLRDGRNLIETIYEDGEVRYNDGFFIVEVDEYCLYVDLTILGVKEMVGNKEYPCVSNIDDI